MTPSLAAMRAPGVWRLQPGVYSVRMTRTAGSTLYCFAFKEFTVDLTPDGIADAASTFDAGGVDAGSCPVVAPAPGPGCRSHFTCNQNGDAFDSIFVEKIEPQTLTGSQHWTMVRSDGVILDCTWAIAYLKQ